MTDPAEEAGVDIGVGRYGLRTFKPAIVRGAPYLVSVSQEAIPPADPRFVVKAKWRELLTDSHPISWADGTCKAVCTRWGDRWVDRDRYMHEAPDKDCNCGIYALNDLRGLYNQYPSETMAVVAVISASGRTFEHNDGIKTQFARVVAYWVLDHDMFCTCRLCHRKANQYVQGATELQGASFPYVECCEEQFVNAQRFDQPDEMAVHYGLTASPLPAILNRFAAGGGIGGKTGVDLAPLLHHPHDTGGHYEFEIPMGSGLFQQKRTGWR